METAKKSENNEWITAGEFEGDGLTLKCKSFKKIKANNPVTESTTDRGAAMANESMA